jgi:hypothetical protein
LVGAVNKNVGVAGEGIGRSSTKGVVAGLFVGSAAHMTGGAMVGASPPVALCANTALFFEVITAAAPAATLPLTTVRLLILRDIALRPP